MYLPNFLVIGTSHAGTTSLYYCLKQHPQVFLPKVKEPGFFTSTDTDNPRQIRDAQAYADLFAGSESAVARGEMSPYYLHAWNAGQRIKDAIPDVKLIVILREPVSRAFSHYLDVYVDQPARYLEEFEAGFLSDPQHWFVQLSYYAPAIRHYLDLFDRQQFLFLVTEQFAADPTPTLDRICEFLGADSGFDFDLSLRHNASGLPKSRIFNALFGMRNVNHIAKQLLPDRVIAAATRIKGRNLKKPELPTALAGELRRYFVDDVSGASDLTGLDLGRLWNY